MKSCHNFFKSIFTLIFLILNLPSTNAEIKHINIKNDIRSVVVLDVFRFTNNGHANIDISFFSLEPEPKSDKPTNLSHVAFFMSSKGFVGEAFHHYPRHTDSCIFTTKPFVKPLFTFEDLSSTSLSLGKKFAISNPDTYAFYFINCNNESQISMKLRLETYNLDADGNKNYLDRGIDVLPTIFSISSLIYLVFFVWWWCICYERKSSTHKIHILMSALLLIKSFESLCLAENKYHVKITGHAHGWDVVWYLFHFIRTLLLFVVIVLIGMGWSFLRPAIHDEGKQMLALGIPIQVFTNILYIAIWESGYFKEEYYAYVIGFFILDLFCCGLIFAPLTSSIQSLKENAKIDGKAAVNLSRLKRFRNFYIILIVYVTSTRFGMLFLRFNAIRNGESFWWITFVSEQALNLLFYVSMFYTFRPTQPQNYVVPSEGDEEAARAEIQESYLLYLM